MSATCFSLVTENNNFRKYHAVYYCCHSRYVAVNHIYMDEPIWYITTYIVRGVNDEILSQIILVGIQSVGMLTYMMRTLLNFYYVSRHCITYWVMEHTMPRATILRTAAFGELFLELHASCLY